MNNPKISVIIPVFNAEKFLPQCLNSVTNQTLRDIEIICVDDGSTDGSLNVLKKHQEKDSRIIILTQKNQYAGVARNHGLKYANGKYIAFLDSDDIYINDALEKMYNIAERNLAEIVKGKFYYLDDKSGRIYEDSYSQSKQVKANYRNKVVSFFSEQENIVGIADVPWNGLYLRSFLDNHKIRFNSLRCVNDHSFFINCFIHAKRMILSDIYVSYYRVGQKNSLISVRSNHYDDQLKSYNIVKEICENLPQKFSRIILRRELSAVFGWYNRLCSNAKNSKKINEQLADFLATFSEEDVGAEFIENFQYKNIYYKLKLADKNAKDYSLIAKIKRLIAKLNS